MFKYEIFMTLVVINLVICSVLDFFKSKTKQHVSNDTRHKVQNLGQQASERDDSSSRATSVSQ